MGKEHKEMRKQIRNVVQEILPEVLANELFVKLQEENAARLGELAKMVVERLNQIEERSKNVQSYIMREMANASAPKPDSQA